MATSMKKTTSTAAKVDAKAAEPVVDNNAAVEEVKSTVSKNKKFTDSDEIQCISITPGKLFVEGKRSDDLYTFADIDDEQWIRYDDLMYLVRTKHASVFKPRFIILDEDFLAQHPEIEEVYGQMFTGQDLRDILELPVAQLQSQLALLPPGAKDALLTIAAQEIDLGRLDSANRIKALDSFFGTKMILKLANE